MLITAEDGEAAAVPEAHAANQGLREKLNSQDAQPVLFLGDEEEFFPGEIKEIILSILDEALSSCKEQSRRNDVVEDLLDHNSYGHVCQKHQIQIKGTDDRLFRDVFCIT